jgi:putative DNA primase/helicase
MKPRTADMARGKWRGILSQLGVDRKYLENKHGPCPICEGTDRYRWDNNDGRGTFICNQCGAGNGFDLLMKLNGWDFPTTAKLVDEVVGNVEVEVAKAKIDERGRADMLNRLWAGSAKLEYGDPAFGYLGKRGVLPKAVPSTLRYCPTCPSPDGEKRQAMIALVQGLEGQAVNIHRTFLGPNGKADMADPRAMMPGTLPDGSAVRLSHLHGERLGIAEGIETALAASLKFNVPVWSAINATMLAKWTPPAGVTEVVIFGDNDPKFGGQAAAYALAARLAGRHRIAVQVMIPETTGTDWADQ